MTSASTWPEGDEFNDELFSLTKPSQSKILSIADHALKLHRFYKSVVHSLEKFVHKSTRDTRLLGLFVIDAVLKKSRTKYVTLEKDIYAQRLSGHMMLTFAKLIEVRSFELEKVHKILSSWRQRQMFSSDLLEEMEAIYESQKENIRPDDDDDDEEDQGRHRNGDDSPVAPTGEEDSPRVQEEKSATASRDPRNRDPRAARDPRRSATSSSSSSKPSPSPPAAPANDTLTAIANLHTILSPTKGSGHFAAPPQQTGAPQSHGGATSSSQPPPPLPPPVVDEWAYDDEEDEEESEESRKEKLRIKLEQEKSRMEAVSATAPPVQPLQHPPPPSSYPQQHQPQPPQPLPPQQQPFSPMGYPPPAGHPPPPPPPPSNYGYPPPQQLQSPSHQQQPPQSYSQSFPPVDPQQQQQQPRPSRFSAPRGSDDREQDSRRPPSSYDERESTRQQNERRRSRSRSPPGGSQMKREYSGQNGGRTHTAGGGGPGRDGKPEHPGMVILPKQYQTNPSLVRTLSTTLFIGHSALEKEGKPFQEIRQFMMGRYTEFGPIDSISSRPGMSFVKFKNRRSAAQAKAATAGLPVMGKPAIIYWAKARDQEKDMFNSDSGEGTLPYDTPVLAMAATEEPNLETDHDFRDRKPIGSRGGGGGGGNRDSQDSRTPRPSSQIQSPTPSSSASSSNQQQSSFGSWVQQPPQPSHQQQPASYHPQPHSPHTPQGQYNVATSPAPYGMPSQPQMQQQPPSPMPGQGQSRPWMPQQQPQLVQQPSYPPPSQPQGHYQQQPQSSPVGSMDPNNPRGRPPAQFAVWGQQPQQQQPYR